MFVVWVHGLLCQKTIEGPMYPNAEGNKCMQGLCGKGKQRTADGAGCEFCPRGKYSSNQSAAACIPCPAGTHCDEKACTQCTSCQAGKETVSAGIAECTQCKPGMFSTLHSLDAKITTTSRSNNENDYEQVIPVICQNCTRGMFGAPDGEIKDDCKDCQAGGYATVGQKECKQCADGKQVVNPSDDCEWCTVGRMQSGRAGSVSAISRKCEYCPLKDGRNTISTANFSSCDTCPPQNKGFTSDNVKCLCAKGRYSLTLHNFSFRTAPFDCVSCLDLEGRLPQNNGMQLSPDIKLPVWENPSICPGGAVSSAPICPLEVRCDMILYIPGSPLRCGRICTD